MRGGLHVRGLKTMTITVTREPLEGCHRARAEATLGFMNRWASVVEAIHVATLAAVVVAVAVDPSARLRSAPDYGGWLTGQQRVDRVMSRVAPPLFLSAAATAAGASVVALVRHRPTLAAGRAVATGCIAGSVAMTLIVNEPMNARLRAWEPHTAPPDDWRAVRRQWDRGHRGRRVLLTLAAMAAVWGASAGRNRSPRQT